MVNEKSSILIEKMKTRYSAWNKNILVILNSKFRMTSHKNCRTSITWYTDSNQIARISMCNYELFTRNKLEKYLYRNSCDQIGETKV